jgi:hypothetical protein
MTASSSQKNRMTGFSTWYERLYAETREREKSATQLLTLFLLAYSYLEDESDIFLRNVGSHKPYTASYPNKKHSFVRHLFQGGLHKKNCNIFLYVEYKTTSVV